MKNHTQKLIFTGLLITIGIVLSQFLSIPIPPSQTTFKIGIGYLPLMLISVFFGPFFGLISGVIQDLIGYFLWGVQTGPFHFGFVLNAILFGVLPWMMFRVKLFKANTYKWFNLVFFGLVLAVSIYLLFDVSLITSRIKDITNVFAYLLIVSSIFATIGIGAFVMYQEPYGNIHQFLFIVTMMLIITSIILTPIWVNQLYGLPYWIQLPPRIIKLPFEAIIYSLLLTRIYQLFKRLDVEEF